MENNSSDDPVLDLSLISFTVHTEHGPPLCVVFWTVAWCPPQPHFCLPVRFLPCVIFPLHHCLLSSLFIMPSRLSNSITVCSFISSSIVSLLHAFTLCILITPFIPLRLRLRLRLCLCLCQVFSSLVSTLSFNPFFFPSHLTLLCSCVCEAVGTSALCSYTTPCFLSFTPTSSVTLCTHPN